MTKSLLKHDRRRDSCTNYSNCWMCKKNWNEVSYKCRGFCVSCYQFYQDHDFTFPKCDKCGKKTRNSAIIGKSICEGCFLKLKEKIISLYEKKLSLAKIRKAIDHYVTEATIYYWLKKWNVKIITKKDRTTVKKAEEILGGNVKKELYNLHWEREQSLGDIASMIKVDKVALFNTFNRLEIPIRSWFDSVHTARYREKRKILFIKNWIAKGQIGSSTSAFLSDPGQFQTLTPEEIYSTFLDKGIKSANIKIPKDLEQNFLIRLAQLGSIMPRNQMIEDHIGLVYYIAKRYNLSNQIIQFDDLVQAGILGLIQAIEKFDFSRGAAFSTCAFNYIGSSIGRLLDDFSQTIRLPAHIHHAISKTKKTSRSSDKEVLEIICRKTKLDSGVLLSPLSLDHILDSIEEEVYREESSLDIPYTVSGNFPSQLTTEFEYDDSWEIIKSVLSEKSYQILRLRVSGFTMSEIQNIFGYNNRQRIDQIIQAALKKIRKTKILNF